MSTQNTTLPPPCGWPTMLKLFIEASATLIRQAQAAECNEHNYEQLLSAVQRVTDYGQQGLSALTKQARAAIAAQAPQPSPLVAVGEDGEGQENHCPECGAEPGQMCSDEEGMEHGRKVHAVRQAQQAQGVRHEPIATFQGRRLTPEGTFEFWGWLRGDPSNDPPVGALLYTAPPPSTSPCQFAIDGGGNLYRRYYKPVCDACVPAAKETDKWESSRVADFNAGWNACREAMLAAAPQAEPVPAKLEISPLEEQQMFDDWCPYKGSPDPRVVWAAAIDAANGLFSGLTERKAPQALTDEQIEAGAKMLGKLWKWDELEAVYKDKYRARFVEAIEAARAASAGGEG